MAAATEAGLDKSSAYRLRLSVDEIATNIIVHGYDEAGRTGDVEVRTEIDDDTLRLYLEDTAVPYDPLQNPPPVGLDSPLEERDIGGLGVYLAIQGVDEFRYEHVGDRNRNIFVMRRPAASSDGNVARPPTGE
jgi:anti-sigma regulatory factor (Ser/Thr protein kinase)